MLSPLTVGKQHEKQVWLFPLPSIPPKSIIYLASVPSIPLKTGASSLWISGVEHTLKILSHDQACAYCTNHKHADLSSDSQYPRGKGISGAQLQSQH